MSGDKGNKNIEDLSKKFTSFGVSLATLEAEEREKKEAMSRMIETIENTIDVLHKQGTLKTHTFFFCQANYFYKNQQQFYYPAEIAFSAFRLQSGLIAAESFFVDPGQIPLGYKHQATEWSSRTHGIPVNDPNWKEGIKAPSEMFDRVKKFTKKYYGESGFPPFYAMFEAPFNPTDRLSAVECAFDMMSNSARGNTSETEFRIYSLPFLVYKILNKCCPSKYPSVAIIKSLLERDIFSYTTGIGCNYHEKEDLSVHCSLSIVKRWVYMICDLCCKYLDIQLVIGRHVPILYKTGWNNEKTKGRFDNGRNKKQVKAPLPSYTQTPITIIDHGWLKEKRAEEKRVRDQFLDKSKPLRLSKQSYRYMTYDTFKENLKIIGKKE